MALLKLSEAYPNYQEEIFGGDDIKVYIVYAQGNDIIGSVYDALIDKNGSFRYFIIDTGFWVFGKKVLVPMGRVQIDYNRHRIYVTGMSKEEVERMPEYSDQLTVDYEYEERVRNVFRPRVQANVASTYDCDTYNYDHDIDLYQPKEADNQRIKLYEERVIANKLRQKTGEVAICKRVETDTAQISIPVEKERVIIERTTPTEATEVTPGTVDFQGREVARMEVYKETADFQKKAFVREEVNIRKEVVQDTVNKTETVRREELDVNTDGTPVVRKNDDISYR